MPSLVHRALFAVAFFVLAASPAVAQTVTPTPTTTPTPTRSVTITPTPTTTQTPVGVHYECYEVNRKPFTLRENVQVTDIFGPSLVDVRQAKRLCNPADKNDEDPTAPSQTEHLVGYKIKQVSPRFLKFPNVFVINQFGTITVDVAKPSLLLVPSTKAVGTLPPPQGAPTIDHYKCYTVQRTAKTNLENVKIDDQFGTIIEDVRRPAHLCVPADKNGEGVPDPTAYRMCYTIKPNRRGPRFFAVSPIFIDNQFDDMKAIGITRPTEICLPSLVIAACCGPNDRCIDADGTLTRGDGIPGAVEVAPGDLLSTFPVIAPNGSGLALFDNNHNGMFTFGFAGDDLAAQGGASCPTGIANGVYDAGFDCPVLDLDGSLTNGQSVDCNLETGAGCTSPLPAPITYHDANGNGAWDSGEDIVLDVNRNGICD